LPGKTVSRQMSVIYVLECWRAKNMDAWNRPAGQHSMPTIAYFYGIAIRMFFIDHPPHSLRPIVA